MSKLDDIAKLVAFAEDVLALAREGGLTAARRGRPPKAERRTRKTRKPRATRTNGATQETETSTDAFE